MSQLQSLKKIIHLLQTQNIINNKLIQSIGQGISHPTIFRLIALIYNLVINTRSDIQDNNRRILLILQELTLIIGNLTSFAVPVKFIATFQKMQFYNYCKDNKPFSCLLNKVFGLYPQMNVQYRVPKLMEFDMNFCNGNEVGNPNWMLTRSILTQWLQQNNKKMPKPIMLSAYLLLSSQKLINLDSSFTLWDETWIYLYLWLNTIFLQPFVADKRIAVTWCNFSNNQYRQLIKSLYKDTGNQQQKIIFNLLQFIIEQFIFNEVHNDYFKQSTQAFLQCQEQGSNWQELLHRQIIKIVSSKLGHNHISQQYQKLIHQTINKAKTENSTEFQYLLPHLLPKSQVKNYIITNSLQFWNYGLQESINEQIAILFLQKFHIFLEQEQRINILLNLNRNYFIEQIINSNLLSIDPKKGEAIIKTILNYPQKIGKRLYSHQQKLSQQECIKNIKIFAKQWDAYYTILFEGIDQSNFSQASKLLVYDINDLKDYSLPQKQARIFSEILYKFTDYFLSNASIHHQDITQVLLNPIFVDYFAKLRQQQKDELWQKWSNFMIDNVQIMQDLMHIPPQNQMEEEQFLSDEQIYQLRKNR